MQQLVQNLLAVGLHHYLILAVVLFGIGTFGVFMRRNALTTLMSIELILNGGNLTLLAFARSHQDMRGQARVTAREGGRDREGLERHQGNAQVVGVREARGLGLEHAEIRATL